MKTKLLNSKKAVVFDLDGTVLDTIGDLAGAVNYALSAYGLETRTVDEVKSFIGNGSLMLIRRALSDENGTKYSDEFVNGVRARFREGYQLNMLDKTYAYDGILELIDELNRKGIATAVVTNKDDRSAVPMIEHYFGSRFALTRGVRADSERKPNPGLTLSVLKELGVTPDEAIFVGDGLADFEVAKNCGIDYIPIGYGYTSPERLYEKCGKIPVKDVLELKKAINELL